MICPKREDFIGADLFYFHNVQCRAEFLGRFATTDPVTVLRLFYYTVFFFLIDIAMLNNTQPWKLCAIIRKSSSRPFYLKFLIKSFLFLHLQMLPVATILILQQILRKLF